MISFLKTIKIIIIKTIKRSQKIRRLLSYFQIIFSKFVLQNGFRKLTFPINKTELLLFFSFPKCVSPFVFLVANNQSINYIVCCC